VTYEVAEHISRTGSVRTSDRSRFGTVRLAVTRNRNGTGTVSVIVRDVRGGMLKDTRLAVAQVAMPEGSLESRDPLALLVAALSAVTGRPST